MWRAALRGYARVFAGRLVRLRSALVFLVPIGVLTALLLPLLPQFVTTVVVDGQPTPLAWPGRFFVVAAVLVLVAWLVSGFGFGAAVLAGLALDAEEPTSPTARGVVGEVVRRSATVLTLCVLVGLLHLALVVGAVALIVVGWSWQLALVLWLLVALGVSIPFALALPAALAENRGPFASLRRSLQLSRGDEGSVVVVIFLTVIVLPGALGSLVSWLTGMATGHLSTWWRTLVDASVSGLVAILTLGLAASAYSAVFWSRDVEGGSRAAITDPERTAPVIDRVRRPDEWAWAGKRAPARWFVTVLAAVLPWVLATGATWAVAAQVPSFRQVLVSEESSDYVSTPIQLPDGRPAVVAAWGQFLDVRTCAADDCRPSLWMDGLPGSDARLDSDGDLVITSWRWKPDEHLKSDRDPRTGQLVVLRCPLERCDEADLRDRYEGATAVTRVRQPYLDLKRLRSVLALRRQGPVIATTGWRTDDEDRSRLRLVLCQDATCGSARTVDLGTVPWQATSDWGNVRSLTLALGADGTPVAAVADPESGAVRLVVCSDPGCTSHTARTVVPPARGDSELTDQYRQGAQVRVRFDGRPVLAFKDALTGRPTVLVCADRSCSRSTRHPVGERGWAQAAPALALDRTGRPLVATYDLTRHRLVLVSCDTKDCSRRTDLPLVTWAKGPGALGLAVDAQDHPMVSWVDRDVHNQYFGDDGPMRVLQCDRPRCGAA